MNEDCIINVTGLADADLHLAAEVFLEAARRTDLTPTEIAIALNNLANVRMELKRRQKEQPHPRHLEEADD